MQMQNLMPTTQSETDSNESWKSSKTGSESAGAGAADRKTVLTMLATFYGVMGNAPQEAGALVAMAVALCEDASIDRIRFALKRCTKECRFPVRLPDIFTRMPGFEVSQLDAEMRAAWDTVIRYVGKWGRWNCEYDHAHIEAGA